MTTGSGDSTATTAFIGGLEEVTTSAPNVWLSGFSPTTGPVGASVTVTGSGFNTTAGATSVSFHGVPATSVSVTSATQLTATVPAGASTGPITVSTSQGSATSSGDTPSSFIVATTPPAPAITSFSPTSGPVGTIITLLGAHFTRASGVSFNGTAATSFTVVSDSQLTATVPTGATTGPISVTTPGGVATTTSVYTVSAAPSDTLFSDNFEQDPLGAAPAGWSVTSGTWAVESDGTHVLQQTDTTIGSSVYITPTVAGSANWTDYTVSADVKPGADNTSTTSANLMGRYTDSDNHYSLILKNNDEWWLGVKQAGNWTTIANGTFSYNSSTFYTLTLSLQGTTISGAINGTVVGSGTDTTFSSGGIGFSTAANIEIDNVSVVDGTGQGGGSPPPAPTLSSFTPTSGVVGSTVTLTGSGFTGASSVAVHGTLASSFTVVSDSQLTAVVPAGATTGPISVTTPGGSATSSGSFTVTTSAPPPPPTTTTTTAYYGGGIAESVNGTLSYLLSDPVLDSASASVNLSGAVTATQLYAPYGSVRYSSGILPTDIGFTHQRSDATSGLDDYGARWYDPVAGQFTSADTTLAGGLNRYAYVAGNPETNTDPSGHLYAPPRNTSRRTAMYESQAQPVKVYANQWAAPGSVGGFVSYVAQKVFATDTLKQTLHIMSDPHASTGDKAKATGVFVFTAFTDVLTLASIVTAQPEGVEGARAADAAVFAFADLDHMAVGADAGDLMSLVGCGESFTPDTRVATPAGERPIAALQVGDHVTAYDPTTGKQTTQTVERVFLNHDTDRLDVTLAYTSAHSATPSQDAQDATNRPSSGHRRSMPAKDVAPAGQTEVIHTTASHPWLTADHGWVRAGQLHDGEAVRLLDGATATVVALHSLPGAGPMWDLSLDNVHTFAVGDVQAVVHNCDPAETLSNYRQDLQVGKDRTVAYADYSIGDDQGRVASVSGQASRPGAVDAPSNRLFETTQTGNNSRMYDAENKVLEYIGSTYANNPSISGTVDLYVDREPCVSCQGVFTQFSKRFPNITLHWTWIH